MATDEYTAQLESLIADVYTIVKETLGGTMNWSSASPMARIYQLLNQQDYEKIVAKKYTEEDVLHHTRANLAVLRADINSRMDDMLRELDR